MIAYLNGTILHKDIKYLILDVNSVGYKVSTPVETLNSLHEGNPAQFWIYTVVREDALDLYGFLDKDTLSFFELLITISGIGPKSALSILSAASVDSLKEAIITGETAYITKISGIGKKVADKIVLELKGKVVHTKDVAYSGSGQSDVDAVEALKALGYTHKEARDALEDISKDIKEPGEMVKAALRVLSK